MMGLKTVGARLRPAAQRLSVPPKQVDPHYQSDEHKAWRAAVIRRAAGRCEASGCGRTGERLFADHIVELKDGGAPFDLSNGQALCGGCHTAKTMRARKARLQVG